VFTQAVSQGLFTYLASDICGRISV